MGSSNDGPATDSIAGQADPQEPEWARRVWARRFG